jgi:hypothetical protein
MTTNQPLSSPDKADARPVPTLDESLAQLEEALDLFASHHGEGQLGATHPLNDLREKEERASITPIFSTPIYPAESAPVTASPIKDESFEQAIKELKQKIAAPNPEGIAPVLTSEVVIRAPEDEEGLARRRFPVFTDAQKRMMLLALVIMAFFALIGYLIWQRQKTDELRLAVEKRESMQLRSMSVPPAATAAPVPTPTTALLPTGDQGLTENIKQILIAYNPTAANERYKVEVKDGTVTLTGEVQSQLEKDGVENILKPLTGIKKIVNNLTVKGFAPAGGTPVNGPVMFPQVNPVEARRLEEALKRDLAEGAKRAEEERLRIEQNNAQLTAQRTAEETAKQEAAKIEAAKQEAERLRRQQSAALNNEEDAAFRRQAEERLKQREKEDADRRAEEQRKAEAAPRLETQRTEANQLRVGTVTWRGLVKGVEDVIIRGSSTTVQHVSGGALKDAKGQFSTAMPPAPMNVRLVAASGPAPIRVIQQPSASNNFTTIVRVGDGGKAEGKLHTFTLRWAAQ